VAELRSMGVFVQSLSMVGKGCPDLLCGFRGRWLLCELKNPRHSPSRQRLTEAESKWVDAAREHGPVLVATTTEEIFNVLVELDAYTVSMRKIGMK